MSDRRERVAAAIEGVPNFSTIQDVAQAAIAAMGLPEQGHIENMLWSFGRAFANRDAFYQNAPHDQHIENHIEGIGRYLEQAEDAARQRLLDLIPTREDGTDV